jgi:GDP-4-dehydro-6-deoxy-D-mannose reductase
MDGPVLVTGASGFAGGHLVEALSGSGATVVGWHRAGPGRSMSSLVTWQTVDLLDRMSVRASLAALRPAIVYHCAGAAHVGGSWGDTAGTLAVNVLGTHHLVEALRELDLEAAVLIPSSALVYAPADHPLREDDSLVPDSPYGLSKLAQEMVGTTGRNGRGPRLFVARAFNHLGPRQSASFVASAFARQIAEIEAGRADPVLKVGNLEARRDLTDVRDTVRAYQAIVERGTPFRPYNVCSGHAVAIRDLLDMMIARARVPVAVSVDQERYRPNDVPLVIGDPSRVRDEIGWRVTIPLQQTLDDVLAFWRSHTAQ